VEGPHRAIRTDAWDEHAADLVGRLGDTFERAEHIHHHLAQAAEWGFTANEGRNLPTDIDALVRDLESLRRPTWFDRHIWRL
jgi:hypothetical protein